MVVVHYGYYLRADKIPQSTRLSIGLPTCTHFSSNHLVQILYLFVHPPFFGIFGNLYTSINLYSYNNYFI